MLSTKKLTNRGFTIIELMIATSVFSVILLVCATGLIQTARMYQKGVIRSQTQEVARSVIVSIAESIQFSGGDVSSEGTHTTDLTSKGFCVDNKRFSYRKDKKLVDGIPNLLEETNHALVVDTLTGCSANRVQNLSSGPVSGNELLSPNMRVAELAVCKPRPPPPQVPPPECPDAPPTGSNLYQVRIKIAYGDTDLFDGSGNCIALRLGGSFCAASSLSTTVQKRIIR